MTDEILKRKLAAINSWKRSTNADAAKKGLPPVVVGADERLVVERMPTGSASLDAVLAGGWPKGTWIEIYGPESSGKSTLAYATIAELHRRSPDSVALLIDLENAYDPDRGRRMGIDPHRLEIMGANTAEDVFTHLEKLIDVVDEKGHSIVDLVVLDSIATLMTAAEDDAEFVDAQVATTPRLLSKVLRKLNPKIGRAGVVILMINQVRMKIGVMYGPNEDTPGGRAIKFYSSVRIETRRIEAVKDKETEIAQKTRVSIRKNKTAGGRGASEVMISRIRGLEPEWDLVKLGIRFGTVEKKGSFYSTVTPNGEIKEQGEANFAAAVRRDRAAFAALYDATVAAALTSGKPLDDDVESADTSEAVGQGIDEIPAEEIG